MTAQSKCGISACCGAKINLAPKDKKIKRGSTYWYECDKCGEPCNVRVRL